MAAPNARVMLETATAAQGRLDTWNRLREAANRLATRPAPRPEQAAALNVDVDAMLSLLAPVERYWAFPGADGLEHLRQLARRGDNFAFAQAVAGFVDLLSAYGDRAAAAAAASPASAGAGGPADAIPLLDERLKYFTVLVADDMPVEMAAMIRRELHASRRAQDLVYELVFVASAEDAVCAALLNTDVQAVVIRHHVPLQSDPPTDLMASHFADLREMAQAMPSGLVVAEILRELRPHLDLYLVTEESLADLGEGTYRFFDRVFYRYENTNELHMTLLDGVRQRFRTPFFDALRHYADRPVGNFHALPIARGHSVFNSKWLQDMAEFYGEQIFMAETSSTSGGLDSLLDPKGVIREAEDLAAATWGSMQTYFVTNGTSTSNKIVTQALTRPGDVVLVDRNCHISHHYAMVLNGARPVYLDAYPLAPFAIYGAVPLREMKRRLLELRRAGRLDAVRMLLLTNCTFDGIVYDPVRVMEEVLAIKPDICFLWDEAWYAFANFMPMARERTGMWAARTLAERYAGDGYRAEYDEYRARMDALDPDDDATWLDNRLMPDPDAVRVRVYTTHSTHKSLSALRQGSMIHVFDKEFAREAAETFAEAYNTHTSTSPNYQIVASLDLARRQANLEGYAMVANAYSAAFTMRALVASDPLLGKFFRVLEPEDLVPAEFRPSGLASYVATAGEELESTIEAAWSPGGGDEFALDPTRVTLYVAATGLNGDEFKNDVLMERYGIQINKTSINSVLFIVTIGVTWGSLGYLLDVLRDAATHFERQVDGASRAELRALDARVHRLTEELPHLPDFSEFHAAFRPHPASPEGDMRSAYFLAYDEANREYLTFDAAAKLIDSGRAVVATSMVVPYPPGFPVLVPGQVVSRAIVEFLQKLDVKEIHGYRPELGLSVFTEAALAAQE